MSPNLPIQPSLEQLRKRAKELKRALDAGDAPARDRAIAVHPRWREGSGPTRLSDAQLVLAREYGFESWSKLKNHVESQRRSFEERVAAFVRAALVYGPDHRAGSTDRAQELLREEPRVAGADIYTASMLGDVETVRARLEGDPALARKKGGPLDWEPLLYLCFSRYLRVDPERAERMVETAKLLLEAGADPNAYWIDPQEGPDSRETPLYGAAGVANNVALARLLLEAGADPNDGETPYHAVEHDGVPCAELLFRHGLNEDGKATALLHKTDYPDLAGLRKLLELGCDPDATGRYSNAPLHQAVFRGHGREFFELLFEFGADPDKPNREGKTAYALAARSGNREIMAVLREHGASDRLAPADRFLAACALGDGAAAASMLADNPDLLAALSDLDRAQIVEVAAIGNTAGVRAMLDAGFDVNARGRIWNECAAHRAAMDGHLETVRLLVERGADLTLRDRSYHSSPLGWAEHGGKKDVLEFLLRDPSRIDLLDAVTYGKTGRVMELLEGAEVNAAFGGGAPGVLLRAAAHAGHAELVQGLLERGADPRLANDEGQTARTYAERNGHAAVVALLERAEG